MTTERDCAPETLGAFPKPRGSHEVCLVHMGGEMRPAWAECAPLDARASHVFDDLMISNEDLS